VQGRKPGTFHNKQKHEKKLSLEMEVRTWGSVWRSLQPSQILEASIFLYD
jgi:hypothetical protein